MTTTHVVSLTAQQHIPKLFITLTKKDFPIMSVDTEAH